MLLKAELLNTGLKSLWNWLYYQRQHSQQIWSCV